MNRRTISFLLALLMIIGAVLPVSAQDGSTPADDDATKRVFLPLVTQPADQQQQALTPSAEGIQLESTESLSKEEVAAAGRIGNPQDLQPVSLIVVLDESANADAIAAGAGGQVVHRYEKIFKGASMVVPSGSIPQVADANGVQAVYLDELLQPDTEVSPGFIGATTIWAQMDGQGNGGEGVTVGILDTGIWPEHPSFSDPDPFGEPYAAPAVLPGANGFGAGPARSTCDFGNTAHNPNDVAFTCNNKLIGAYEFLDTFDLLNNFSANEFDSARDDDGHGTHTASTAAGNGGVAASIFGVARGTVSGIAPRAHVIMYRVCTANAGCYSSDSAAAIEQAILDKVDAINFSISGGENAYSDIVELAFLKAYENGVFVAASAGNSGPTADTAAHRGPWTTTVAASTSNRAFVSTLTVSAANGDTLTLSGVSVTDGIAIPTTVEVAGGDGLCQSTMPAITSGNVVICKRGVNGRVEKGYNVSQKGAAGMILYNAVKQDVETDNHFLPAIHLDGPEGAQLIAFFNNPAHTGVKATFTPSAATLVQGDVIAGFSSRGGPGQNLGVSKPDITAPGVQILAGHTPKSVDIATGPQGELFQAIAGTSMSSPHIAGAGALLKSLHPNWTPGQIKSAIMMTAKYAGVVKEDGVTPAGPFDFGSGRVDLTKAGNPGLIISETGANFLSLENALWKANYPSLYVPVMPGKITVQRTAHNLANSTVVWRISVVSSPPDLKVTVPSFLTLPPNGDASFNISVDATAVPLGQVRHARLELRSDTQSLTFPITIVRKNAVVTVNKTCAPGTLVGSGKTICTISLANNSFDAANVVVNDVLPSNLRLVAGSVVGGVANGNAVSFNGMLNGLVPPDVNAVVDPDGSPYGYFALSSLGVPPQPGFTDESIANYSVRPFLFGGKTWSRIGVVSNGYVVVGGGDGGDVQYINVNPVPNSARPNNTLAPFWTDLNPEAGGAIRVATLSDSGHRWIVVDFENVPNYGDGELNSFQVWIGTSDDASVVEDISFTYGTTISDGDDDGPRNGANDALTVGAENEFGNRGKAVYLDGVGAAPAPSYPEDSLYQVVVSSVPAPPPAPTVITFQAQAVRRGPWTNCAEMTSSAFDGAALSCFSGINR
jgi:uncharacterized repeat protein (TIGR01451 family)